MKVLLKMKPLIMGANEYTMMFDATVTPTSVAGMRCMFLCSGDVLINTVVQRTAVAEAWTMHDLEWPEVTEETEKEVADQ